MSEIRAFLVTSGRAVTGEIIRAESPEAAAFKAFGKKKLAGQKNEIVMFMENSVSVYPLGPAIQFHPKIDYNLTGVEEAL